MNQSSGAKYADAGSAFESGRRSRRSFDFIEPQERVSGREAHYPVVIVGAGPVGLAAAIGLTRAGVKTLVLEKHNAASDGSRAICWSKRSLEILDRYGVAEKMLSKGVTWSTGKVFYQSRPEPLYEFDLLPDKQQKFPAFINLQQYYVEEYLIDELASQDASGLRWYSEVCGVEQQEDHVRVTVRTPADEYQLTCDYLLAADGHKSPVRGLLGLEFDGRVFEDNFLIADVIMSADFPAERWFWFDPDFNKGKTALLHKQADDVWRIDFQLGNDVDRDEVLRRDNVDAMVKAFLGSDIDFHYEWVSLYRFQCRRMSSFVHDRVLFAGDSAHLVSPFGARGANGGLQDVDNLVWKLAGCVHGQGNLSLLQSYNSERVEGADENILNSTRATDFITPKTRASRLIRNAALRLSHKYPFARAFVNSGRLSMPCSLEYSALTTPDEDMFSSKQRLGEPCIDAPVDGAGWAEWLLEALSDAFTLLVFTSETALPPISAADLGDSPWGIEVLEISLDGANPSALRDTRGLVAQHYDASSGSAYLVRPDHHVAARWRRPECASVLAALDRATAVEAPRETSNAH